MASTRSTTSGPKRTATMTDLIALASQASQAERLAMALKADGGQPYELAQQLSAMLKRRLVMQQISEAGIERREAKKRLE